jgi:hypothetical protein
MNYCCFNNRPFLCRTLYKWLIGQWNRVFVNLTVARPVKKLPVLLFNTNFHYQFHNKPAPDHVNYIICNKLPLFHCTCVCHSFRLTTCLI